MPISFPTLVPVSAPAGSRTPRPITLVVFAPFDDPALAGFPRGTTKVMKDHPLCRALQEVAAKGVNVAALHAGLGGHWHQLIPAARPDLETFTPALLPALPGEPADLPPMRRPRTLSELISLAAQKFPGTALVLALEGHGAGYLPIVPPIDPPPPVAEKPDTGVPLLGMGSPLLPGHCPLSTAGIAEALKNAPALAVVHLNNCFNLSIEVLHTIAPFAEFATGYLNYNFFSAGRTYAKVFGRIASEASGRATTAQLARWFAEENRHWLNPGSTLPNPPATTEQPTAGGCVQLSRMPGIVAALDRLSVDLLAALRANGTHRPDTVQKIRQAIGLAQQVDADGSLGLEVPDAMTDLGSLAFQLSGYSGENAAAVNASAKALLHALAGIRVYGDKGQPVQVEGAAFWNLTGPHLAMSVFCPDPLRDGIWDWRSPFYLRQRAADVKNPPPPIAFQKAAPHWIEFIVEYHRGVTFKALKAPPALRYPPDSRTN